MRFAPVSAVLLLTACPPLSPDVVIAPEAPTTLDDLTASVDPASPTATYAWSVDATPLPDLATDTVPASRTSRGQLWTVTASEGGEVLGTGQVVIGNSAPSALVSLPPKGTTGQDVVATLEGLDPDDDAVSFAITWTVDGATVSETSAILPGDLAPRGATVAISVVPSDGQLTGEAVSASTVMENGIPSVESAVVSPAAPLEGDEVSCVGMGWSDPDGDPQGYRVSWAVSGVDVSTSAVLTGADFDKGDEIVCELTPWDGSIEGEPVRSAAVLVGNTAPSLTEVSFTPETPRVGETVTAVPGGLADVDGDRVTVRWAWDNDGTDLRTDTAELELETRWAHRTLRAIATPTDGEDEGEAVIGSFEVANSTPEIVGASIGGLTSGELRHGSRPSVGGVTVTDADGDEITLSYAWKVNGAAVATGAVCTACDLVRGDSVEVTVTANDGFGGSADWVWTGVTQNSPPTPFTIEVDAGSGQLGSDVYCDVVGAATDLDGDTLTYTASWTIDGKAHTGGTDTTTHADDTLPSEEIRLDDVVACTMEVSDGLDVEAASARSVTLDECAPVPGFTGGNVPVDLSERRGFCFYLTQEGKSCDDTCGATGGANHAADAAVALGAGCSGPKSGEPAYDFLVGANEGGWTGSFISTSTARSLGHGYDGGLAYGACSTGTANIGAWPGQKNSDTSRSLVCACF